MRITTLLWLVSFMHLSAATHSQTITLVAKNKSLESVLVAIKQQTGYPVLYNEVILKSAKAVTIKAEQMPLTEFLDLLFQEQSLKYRIYDKTILITKRTINPERQKITRFNPVSSDANAETSGSSQFRVSGKVLDPQRKPLAGVSVRVEGSALGTITNTDGEYQLTPVSDAGILVFSYLGYLTQKRPIEGNVRIDVVMQEDAMGLDEVMVTALGVSRKERSLIYATQQVDAEQLTEVRDPNNLLNAFHGKVANAYITQGAFGVGSEAQIILRGERSISGDNSALIVVDGVPSVLGISNINVDDIESISVLPSASAGALYGSQAGNGVILVTTKKGQSGRIAVTVNSGLTQNSPFSLPAIQNSYGQGSNGNISGTTGDSWGAKMEGQTFVNHLGNEDTYTAQPDNIRDFFGNSVSANNAIGISGGTDRFQNYLSYTNNSVQGIIPTNDLVSHTFTLRSSLQISSRLSTDAKFTYFAQDIRNKTRGDEANNTPVMNIYQIPRNMKLADAEQYEIINNVGVPNPTFWPSTSASNYQNPFWVINHDILNGKKDQLAGFLSAKYQLTNWLNISARASLEKSLEREKQRTSQGTILFATKPGGFYRESQIITAQKWFDLILEGSNNLTDQLKIDYLAGAIVQDNSFDQVNEIADGLNVTNKFNLNFATGPRLTSVGSHIQTQSVFGQFNLSYKERLYLDASLRNDWDSRLPAPYAYQYYSIGGAAILSDFFSLPEPLSYLKAKLNYAEVGNGGEFALLNSTFSYVQGAGNGYLSRSNVFPIPDLKPEIVKNIEAGLEAKFLKNRLALTVTYYKSNSFNQLLRINIPVATGYLTKYINAGNIQNRGVEFIITGSPVKNQAFSWDVDANLSLNRNRVISLTDELNTIYLGGFGNFGAVPQVKVGGSYGDLVADQWQRDAQGNRMVTAEGLPLITSQSGADPQVIGNFNPKAIFGVGNTFGYKSLSLRVLLSGRVGGIMVSNTEQNLSFSGITEATGNFREGGWNLGGVDVDGNPVSATINAQRFWQTVSGKRAGVGEFFAYDASNLRVREISLTYDLSFLKSVSFIESAKISVVGRNLLWLYRGSSLLDIPGIGKRKMWFDPDMSKYAPGTEYGAIPSTRSLGLNLQIAF